MITRGSARTILRSFFPCVIQDTTSYHFFRICQKFNSYESLRRKDPILADDILDCLEWNQPIPYEIKPLCDCQ